MKKKNVLLSLITSMVLCTCMLLTCCVLFVVRDKEEESINPPAQTIVAEDTGASVAGPELKGGFLYLAPGAKYTMTGGSLTGGQNLYGGAVYVSNGATFTMTGGTITGCFAKYGGAIYVESGGTCKISGGEISGNFAEYSPAIYLEANANLEVDYASSLISNNLYKSYAVQFMVYDGDALVKTYVDTDYIFDVTTANTEGLSYESCTGYFYDKEMTAPIADNTMVEITEPETGTSFAPKTALQTSNNILKVYTKRVYSEHIAKLEFTTIEDGYAVSAKTGSISGEVAIPAMYEGANVITINEEGFSGCGNVTEIALPSFLTSIEDNSFNSCVNLSEVVIHAGITNIGEDAFGMCSNLYTLVVGEDNVSYMSEANAVYTKDGLTLLFGCNGTTAIKETTTTITKNSFNSCANITSITIPANVTSIGNYAFANMNNLTEVIYNAKVESFGLNNNVFVNAGTGGEGITVSFGENVTRVPSYMFDSSANITAVGLNNESSIVGESAFKGVSTLGSLNITASAIESYAFSGCTGLTSATLNVSGLSVGAFSDCTGLETLTFLKPFGVSAGDQRVFYNIGEESEGVAVTMADGQTEITSYLFYDANLKSISIPSTVISVGDYAFYGNENLGSLNMPSTVTSIGLDVLKGCSGLVSLSIPYIFGYNNVLGYIFDSTATLTDGDGVTHGGSNTNVPNTLQYVTMNKIDNADAPDYSANTNDVPLFAFYNLSDLVNISIGGTTKNIGEYAFYGCSSASNVTFNSGSGIVGDYAFNGCVLLENLSYTAVESVGQYAFNGCAKLKSASISEVDIIGTYAFAECTSLKTVGSELDKAIISSSNNLAIGDYAFYKSGLEAVYFYDYTTSGGTLGTGIFKECASLKTAYIATNGVIPSNMFSSCKKLLKVDFDSVFSPSGIEGSAFYNCGITRITIPNTVKSIGHYAFNSCSMLTLVEFEEDSTLEVIEDESFYSTSLVYFWIPKSVTTIYASYYSAPWYFCDSLNTIYCEAGSSQSGWDKYFNWYCEGSGAYTTAWGISQSYCSQVFKATGDYMYTTSGSEATLLKYFGLETDVEIPSTITDSNGTYTITSLADSFMEYNYLLESVVIPNTITTIGYAAFSGCSSLSNVSIPESVTSIASNMFSRCTALTDITIPSGVGGGAFSDCVNLARVTITDVGSGVIESYAFRWCNNLKTITIPSSVRTLEDWAFYGCSELGSVLIGEGVTNIDPEAFYNCNKLVMINVSVDNATYRSYDNAIYTKDGLKLVLGSNGTRVLLSGVEIIGEEAFSECEGLTSIVIPDSVTTIEEAAFDGCTGLTSIVIPDSVTSIGGGAFRYCTGLTSIVIPNSVTSIGGQAFKQCKGLTSIVIPNSVTTIEGSTFVYCEGLTSIVIPNSVTIIGASAFSGCTGLTSVIIPDSVTTIGYEAFNGCTKLRSIYIPASVTTMSAGSYYFSPFYGCSSSLKIYCGASSKPSGWGKYFNYYSNKYTLTVKYGYTWEQYLSATGQA